ncbi:MAG: hypothetical protein Q4B45_10010, partial [Coriobacteriia bacterium]|nr:hypothetical protein [Coriobacteriia bacterium]
EALQEHEGRISFTGSKAPLRRGFFMPRDAARNIPRGDRPFGGRVSQSRTSFEDYEGFVEKFKPKRTTDDCFTPPEIYAVVLDYVRGRWGVEEADVVRPFWPGGDYESFDYPDGCCVVDNPPFCFGAVLI